MLPPIKTPYRSSVSSSEPAVVHGPTLAPFEGSLRINALELSEWQRVKALGPLKPVVIDRAPR